MDKADKDLQPEINSILALCDQMKPKNPLRNIHHYNDEMTISQVVRFFERQGVTFTKTMIQNYVRMGMIPLPKDKRNYTKDHLILLTIIEHLKSIYTLEEIKEVFDPILKDPSTFSDDMVKVSEIYSGYLNLYQVSVGAWTQDMPHLLDKTAELIQGLFLEDPEKRQAFYFMAILMLMAQSIAVKQMVRLIMEKMGE